jgi:hypothetical protein
LKLPLLTRRSFLGYSIVTTGVLTTGLPLPAMARIMDTPESTGMLAAWVRISHQDGGVTILLAQGNRDSVDYTVLAPAQPWQLASAVTSASSWQHQTQAALAARELLLNLAAVTWNADPAECQMSNGIIHHPRTGRRIGYMVWVDHA